MKLFGFEINRVKKEEEKETQKVFTPEQKDDGAVTVQTGSHYGTYVDIDGANFKNEIELITRYREMAIQAELENAISDIVNESIVRNDDGQIVSLNTEKLEQSQAIKKKLEEEFENTLKLLDFKNLGYDIFRQWYIDGRLFYHVVIDENAPSKGIQELRYIDPRRIRKFREIQRQKDPITGMNVIAKVSEYYLYNEMGMVGAYGNLGQRIAIDSIINVNSGLLDAKRKSVISYLHKAIKPLNMLRMVEDATVIYRLARAPEKRLFYIDVGNLPTVKADQYVQDIMAKYRNKLVYDSSTGEIRDDRKFMAMLEDFWLPRREGSRGSEISSLPGGENLGKIEDVEYFEKKLYKSLGVPYSRSQPETGFSLGRTTEITRDEVKFSKFIDRIRNKFSALFDGVMRLQVILKGICTEDEWLEFREDIWYDFLKDNNFNELKEEELLRERLSTLATVDPYVGRYYSKAWVMRNVLKFTEEDIEDIEKEIKEEGQEALANQSTDEFGNTIPTDNYGNPMPGSGGMNPELYAQDQQNPNDMSSVGSLQTSVLDKSRANRYNNNNMGIAGA